MNYIYKRFLKFCLWYEVYLINVQDCCVITIDTPSTDEEIFAEFSEDNSMEDADKICDDTEEEVVTMPFFGRLLCEWFLDWLKQPSLIFFVTILAHNFTAFLSR